MGLNLKIDKQLENYITKHSLDLTPIQKEIINFNKNLGKIKKMQISINQCHFLHLMIKIYNPKQILEIGTFTGLSSLTMGIAMGYNANLTALDKNKETSEIARRFFIKANLGNKIDLIIKDANESLNELIKLNKIFDIIFIDADKENYKNYFEKSLKILSKSGIIIIDNVLWYGDVVDKKKNDKLTNKIREFNKFIKNDNRVENMILPLGDGLSICRKL
tara:strand:+ start:1191 stop:1847 length:657 start_codon:yes stop_codon:yes gene_type:complete